MATVMDRHRSQHVTTPRPITQKVCIGMGLLFIMVGLGGIVMPGMFGMHLSLAHNVIHLLSGVMALWCGYADDSRKAYNFSIAFGTVYGLLGLAGYVFGEPGYPGVGHMEADEYLLRVIPNVLEFGSADHNVNIIISTVFLVSAYAWKKRSDEASRGVVNTQARVMPKTSDVFRTDARNLRNSESDLKDADLGRSDINRKSDYDRRSDFERRI